MAASKPNPLLKTLTPADAVKALRDLQAKAKEAQAALDALTKKD